MVSAHNQQTTYDETFCLEVYLFKFVFCGCVDLTGDVISGNLFFEIRMKVGFTPHRIEVAKILGDVGYCIAFSA